MTGTSKQPPEPSQEHELAERPDSSPQWFASFDNAVRWIAIVAACGILSDSIRGLAGKTTIATIGIRILADLKISDAVALVLVGSSGIYAVREYIVRKKAASRFEQTERKEADLHLRVVPDPEKEDS